MSSERHVNHHPSESCTGACPGNQRGGLNIEALRLTEEDKNVAGLYSIHSQQRDYVADAQLAKALWGYREHLKELESQQTNAMILEVLDDLVADLGVALEQANVKRPASSQAVER